MIIKIVWKEIFWAYYIKIAQKYKIKDLLKNLPFYNNEIKKSKKKKKNFTNARFISELPFFPKKVKNLTNY